MFKPDDFLSHFAAHKDFAKTSKFQVVINTPPILVKKNSRPAADLRFQCEASELPGYNINTVESRIYGIPTPVAATASYNDITLTFICAGDLWEKKFFDAWVNNIIQFGSYLASYKSEYQSRIAITQYSEAAVIQGNEMKLEIPYQCYLVNAFPVSVAPLPLNWNDDSVHKLNVVFKYDYWTLDPNTYQSEIGRVPAGAPNATDTTPNGYTGQTNGIRPTVPGSRTTPPTEPFRGGGGRFAGAGASGSWENWWDKIIR
jgi:uncharacterized membrane protein YgcG